MNKIILAALAAALLATNSFAMQINLNLANDIKANNDKLNIAFDVYYTSINSTDTNILDQHMNIGGMPSDKVSELMKGLNSMFAGANPVDSINGQHSQFTLGYIKADGTTVTPATCQNIAARPILNIELSEAGCIIS